MGNLFIKSDNVITEIVSAYRFKKEIVNDEYQYGYILFYENLHSTEFKTVDGHIEHAWKPGIEVKETYIVTDDKFKDELELNHHIYISPTYADAFWKAHRYELKDNYNMPKEEFFYVFNKYYHLTIEQSEEDRIQEAYCKQMCKDMEEEMLSTLKHLNKEIQKLNLYESNPIMRYMRDLMLYHIGE